MKLAIIVAKTDPFYEFVESANTIWAALTCLGNVFSSNKFLLSMTETLRLLYLLLLFSLVLALTLAKFIHIFVAERRQIKGGNNMLEGTFLLSLLYCMRFSS